jgi:hypothetical protein
MNTTSFHNTPRPFFATVAMIAAHTAIGANFMT